MLGEESYARARRWDYTIPTLSSELTFFDHPLKSTYIERIVSYIDFLLEFFSVKKDDVIITSNNYGRNSLIVEMALKVKKIGVTIIGNTSFNHYKLITSCHESKLLLKDIFQIVIGNYVPSGDASIEINKKKVGIISTIIDIFIVKQLVTSLLEILKNKDMNFNILLPSNLNNQDERSKKILSKSKEN